MIAFFKRDIASQIDNVHQKSLLAIIFSVTLLSGSISLSFAQSDYSFTALYKKDIQNDPLAPTIICGAEMRVNHPNKIEETAE